MKLNPFKVIKATNLQDDNIVKYWVDIFNSETEQNSFLKLLAPEVATPMIILGGKGSGKTHILRYYSYLAQKIRAFKNNKSPLEQIKDEGFISVYLELENFAFNRFSGSEIPEKNWNEWYYYYLNIILVEAFIEQIIDLQKLSDFNDFNISEIQELIDDKFFEEIKLNSLLDLLKNIKKSHKEIDSKLSRISTGLETDFQGLSLLFNTSGHEFFNIVHTIMKSSNQLKDIRVVYLIDQLEDLSPEQQKYTNTLIRHSKHNETISLRFAGRLHAIKTVDTFSDKEKILNAEVEIKHLENFMIDDKDSKKTHEDFSIRLCQNRLQNVLKENFSKEKIKSSFKENNLEETIKRIIKKHPKSEDRFYFKELYNNLTKYSSQLGLSSAKINLIIENLSYPQDPLIEKKNIYLLYQAGWSKNLDLLKTSIEISESLKIFISRGNSKLHNTSTLKHIEDNLYYQLLKTYHLPIYHCGFSSILNYTLLNPRSFINILNFMHEHCEFADENLFYGEPISCKVQNRAIREASDWFWTDAINDIENKNEIRTVKRLTEFFKKVRLSDKPYEKTLISFAYDNNLVREETKYIIKGAQNHSLLLEDKDGKIPKNNSEQIYKKFQINPMLTIKWDLPSTVGDTHEFDATEIDTLCLGEDKDWEKITQKYIKPLSIPFKMSKQTILDL